MEGEDKDDFEQIETKYRNLLSHLNTQNEEENPQHRDRFFWLRKLTKRFNNNMAIEFNLSWLV